MPAHQASHPDHRAADQLERPTGAKPPGCRTLRHRLFGQHQEGHLNKVHSLHNFLLQANPIDS